MTRLVEYLFTHPARVSWRLDDDRSVTQLAWNDEPPVADNEIEGVLVRDVGWIDPGGWRPDDLAYVQAETQAALLGWLWSLPCPVLNRYPAATWYRPQLPLLSWRSLLWRCGLPVLEALLSNVKEEARAFGRSIAATGLVGAVYRPLTSDARYLVVSDRDWDGLEAMQLRAPVCLTPPHAQPQSACVVGGEMVVWDGPPPPHAATLEPALRRFASAAGLAFVELVLAEAAGGPRVVAVEHHPHFERFGASAQQAIVAGLARLLTSKVTVAAPLPAGA